MCSKPEIVRYGLLSVQVCVPKTFSDEEAKEFVDGAYSSGTADGWHMRKDGDKALCGDPERAQCHEREDCVHIMFDA